MSDETPKSFYRYSASVSVKSDKHYYYWSKIDDSPLVWGKEYDSSLTCWRDSQTADTNCHYVFGIKASASDENYRFIVPHSNSENLQWSNPKTLPSKNVFSLDDDRIFFREKVERDQNLKFKHKKSEKYVHIIEDKIVLRDSKETAPETAVTEQ